MLNSLFYDVQNTQNYLIKIDLSFCKFFNFKIILNFAMSVFDKEIKQAL